MRTKIMQYAIYLLVFVGLTGGEGSSISNIMVYLSLALVLVSLIWDLFKFVEKRENNKE